MELMRLENENMGEKINFLQAENNKLKVNLKSVNQTTTNYEVIENVIQKSDSGLSKKETEDMALKYLLSRFEIQRLANNKENFFDTTPGNDFQKFKY